MKESSGKDILLKYRRGQWSKIDFSESTKVFFRNLKFFLFFSWVEIELSKNQDKMNK